MNTAYWGQWSHAEIMSLHGIEDEEDDVNLEHDEDDTNSSQNCNCSNCMDCLGLSWRDFF